MTYLPLLMGRLLHRPLLCDPGYLDAVFSAMSDRFGTEATLSADELSTHKRPARQGYIDKASRIAVLPVVGGLVHRSESINPMSGMTGYTALQNQLIDYFESPAVAGILLDMDTPGGEVSGLAELANFVREASKEKPIWAIANGMAASAGYWLASGASRVIAAPNSAIGSIGVITAHVDRSKQMEKSGQKVTLIHAGKHKTAGNPFEALPDDVRASVQASLDATYREFVNAVAENRGLKPSLVQGTEAAMFDPASAIRAGLADGTGTFGETLAAFKTHLNNRPYFQGFSPGATMPTELLHSAADISAARAEGAASASADISARVAAAVADATKATSASIAAAVGTLFTGARAEAFVEALADGVAVASAAKFAAKIPLEPAASVAPSRTAADVDKMMAAAAANVQSDAAADDIAVKRAAFRASISPRA